MGNERCKKAGGVGNIGREPCGTGISARMVTQYAKGELGLGETFVTKSIIGTLYYRKLVMLPTFAPHYTSSEFKEKMMERSEFLKQLPPVEARWVVEPFEEDTVTVKAPRVSGKCTGCGICELICSLDHEGMCSPALSRIWIKRQESEWFKSEVPAPYERVVCAQCPGLAPCMAVCPIDGALTRDPDTGAVIINYELCTACEECVEACPYDAMAYHEGMDKVIKCDLCGGKPLCVEWCPPKVLRYVKK